jgi:hypothetical protein
MGPCCCGVQERCTPRTEKDEAHISACVSDPLHKDECFSGSPGRQLFISTITNSGNNFLNVEVMDLKNLFFFQF